MLKAIGAGVTPSVGDQDWKDTWLKSRELVNMKEEIATIKKMALLEEEPNHRHVTTCEQALVDGCHHSDFSKMPLLSYISSRLWFSGITWLYGDCQSTFSADFSFQA